MDEEDIEESRESKELATIRAACEENYANGVAMLLNDKLRKNVGRFKELMEDSDRKPLLITASENGHADVLCILLLAIKKLDTMGDHKEWIFSYLHRLDSYGLSALHWCSLKGHIECMSVLLYFEPSLVSCVSRSGQTALELAASSNKRESVEYLQSIASSQSSSKRVSEVARTVTTSTIFKNMFSKNAIIQIYNLLPVYSYLTSLAIAVTLSIYLMYSSCSVQLVNESDCHIGAHSASILMQLIIWWLTYCARNVNPGVLANQRLVQTSECLEDCTPLIDKSSASSSGRTYHNALLRIHELALKNKFTSSHSFCCHRCRCYRPLRSGHSRLSGRCIPLFDHFCSFLWCDIGRDNYIYFILFLVMMCLNLPIFLILTTDHLVYSLDGDFYMKEYGNDWLTSSREGLIKGFTVWCMLVLLMCLVLLVMHIRMSTLGMTSREYMKGEEKFPFLGKEYLYSHCAAKNSSSRHLGILAGYTINLIDKLFPISDDECYDETDMRDLMTRSLDRFYEWREAVSVNALLQRYCLCPGWWSGKIKSGGSVHSDVDEKYTV